MRLRYVCFFVFCIALSIGAQAQSGWTKEKGAWYAQTTIAHFSSNRYYSTEGVLNVGNTFRHYSFNTYAELGLSKRLTALANLPLLKLQSFVGTETVAGVGDLQLGVKYALSKKLPIALGVAVDIPTDDGRLFANAKEVNELGIRERVNLPASDGEWNVRANLAISQSFGGGKTYAGIFGAVNLRTEGFTHQWQSGAEAGQFLFDRLWLIGKLQLQGRLSEEVNSAVSFLYGEGTTYTAYQFNLLYQLTDHWRITAGYHSYSDLIVPKRNLYDGQTWSVGMALEY